MNDDGRAAGASERGARIVRNGDIPILCDILPIAREIEQIEAWRAWQRSRMTNISHSLTGTPGKGALPRGLDDAFSRLAETDEELSRLCKKYAARARAAWRIIAGIQSEGLRAFVMMKYVRGMPDARVRERLKMTRRAYCRALRAIEDAPSMSEVVWIDKHTLDNPLNEKKTNDERNS